MRRSRTCVKTRKSRGMRLIICNKSGSGVLECNCVFLVCCGVLECLPKKTQLAKNFLRALKGLYDGVTGNHEVTGNHGESLLSRHLISSDLISRHFFPAFDTLAANKQTNHSESLHKEKPITLAPISCPSSRPCSPPAPLSQLTPKRTKMGSSRVRTGVTCKS